MLSEEKSMEIREAYDLTGSYRSTAALCGVDHHTVRRHVAARVAGLDPASDLDPPKVSDPYLDKVEGWVERSSGKVRADVVHEKLSALDYEGSERTTRRIGGRPQSRALEAHPSGLQALPPDSRTGGSRL